MSCCCSLNAVFVFFSIEKECDLNKHCRVLDPERKKLYGRELICNVNSQCYQCFYCCSLLTKRQIFLSLRLHLLFVEDFHQFFWMWCNAFFLSAVLSTQTDSIHQQQKAMGKPKSFDQLAAEQRTASAGRDMEQLLVKSKDKEPHLEAFEEKTATQGSKYNSSSNCHILRYDDFKTVWLYIYLPHSNNYPANIISSKTIRNCHVLWGHVCLFSLLSHKSQWMKVSLFWLKWLPQNYTDNILIKKFCMLHHYV